MPKKIYFWLILFVLAILSILLNLIVNKNTLYIEDNSVSKIEGLNSNTVVENSNAPYFDFTSPAYKKYGVTMVVKILNLPPELDSAQVSITDSIGNKKELYSSPDVFMFDDNKIDVYLPDNIMGRNTLSFTLVDPQGRIYAQTKTILVYDASPSPAPKPSTVFSPITKPRYPAATPTPAASQSTPSTNPTPIPSPNLSEYCYCKSIELIKPEYDENGKLKNQEKLEKELKSLQPDNPTKPKYSVASDLLPQYKTISVQIDNQPSQPGGKESVGFIIKSICEASSEEALRKRCLEGQEVKSTHSVTSPDIGTRSFCHGPRINEIVAPDNLNAKCYDPKVDDPGDPNTKDDTTVNACKDPMRNSPGFGSDNFNFPQEYSDGIKKKTHTYLGDNKWEVKWIDNPWFSAYGVDSGGQAQGSGKEDSYFHAYVTGDDCSKDNPKCNLCFTISRAMDLSDPSGREEGSSMQDESKPNHVNIKEVECKYN